MKLVNNVQHKLKFAQKGPCGTVTRVTLTIQNEVLPNVTIVYVILVLMLQIICHHLTMYVKSPLLRLFDFLNNLYVWPVVCVTV